MSFAERDKDRSDKSDGASGDGTDSQEVHGSRVRQSHPSTSESAKATVLINLASSLALCGEWDKARKCIMKVGLICHHGEETLKDVELFKPQQIITMA